MLDELKAAITTALHKLGVPVASFDVFVPKDRANGHVSSNVALVCTQKTQVSPRDLAEQMVQSLSADARFEAVWLAGPGFLNFQLSEGFSKFIADQIRGAGSTFGAGETSGSFAACYFHGTAGLRHVWYAEAAVRLAKHLGYGADIVCEGGCVSAARRAVDAAFEVGGRLGEQHGETSSTEKDLLAKQLAVIKQAQVQYDTVSYFTAQGAGFRPGYFEQTSGSGVICQALAPLELLADEGLFEVAKLVCLSTRSEKKLRLSSQNLKQPTAQNPAFLIQYAALKCREAKPSVDDVNLSQTDISLLSEMASFPAVLRIAHKTGEPQRIGLFMVRIAKLLTPSSQGAKMRDQKVISKRVLAAADVVFSVGLSILGVQPLNEIS